MIRARLWYGPAGHGLEMERVARYLRGPLACDLHMVERNRDGRWQTEIELSGPVRATVSMHRTPEVAGEAADLVSRLPADTAPNLARRLAACTARLDFADHDDDRHFAPSAGVAKSVLLPLAYSMDGLVEDLDAGRLSYHPEPGSVDNRSPLTRITDIFWRLIGRPY